MAAPVTAKDTPATTATGPVTALAGRVSGVDRRTLLVALYALVLGAGTYLLAYRGLTDDGYITLDYARTLAQHGVWGMKADLPANTATSPLNVLLLALLMLVSLLFTGQVHAVAVLGVLTVAAMVAAGCWWGVITRRLGVSGPATAAGLGIVLLSPLALSAIGLETPVLVALLIGLCAEALRGRPVVFGVVAGFAVLTRVDAAVFVLVIGLVTTAIRRRWYRALIPLLVVALPWFVVSWFALGSAIPDTLAIKQQQTYPGHWTFVNGVGLFLSGGKTQLPALIAFVPAVLGLVALVAWGVRAVRRRRLGTLAPLALLGAAGVVHYIAYSILGVPPYLWYYVPTVTALALFFGASLDPLGRWLWRKPAPMTAVVSAVVVAVTLGTDLAHGVPWQAPPIFGNFALPGDYMTVGRDLKTRLHGDAVLSPGELGTLVFACDCNVIDQFDDRGLAIQFLRKQVDAAGPVGKWAYGVNYHNLDWNTPPRPLKYRLIWHRGWVTPRPDTWNTNSPGIGRGHFLLLPISSPLRND